MSETQTLAPIQQHELVTYLEENGAEQQFATVEARQDFLRSMDADQFIGMLSSINAVCRGENEASHRLDGAGLILETNAMSGESIRGYEPPAQKDRKDLLETAFAAAKQTDNMEQAATMLGLAINAIHPFNDGNGRTSRFVYSLFTRGYDGSNESKAYYEDILANTKGRDTVNLDPSRAGLATEFNRQIRERTAQHYRYEGALPTYGFGGYNAEFVEDYNPKTVMAAEDISEEGRQKLDRAATDKNFEGTIFLNFILESGRDPADYIKSVGERSFVLLDKLLPSLTQVEIDQISEYQDALKKRYVEGIIELVRPGNAPVMTQLTELYKPQ